MKPRMIIDVLLLLLTFVSLVGISLYNVVRLLEKFR